jgi:branched-chain amino acid transport system permease protein
MSETTRATALFAAVFAMIALTGFMQSWNVAVLILNMGLISAIMSLGVNLQWGFAGLFNVGVMGFVALGGLAVVLTSAAPVEGAWSAGGWRIVIAMLAGAGTIVGTVMVRQRMAKGRARTIATIAILAVGFFVYRAIFDPAVGAVEAINPALQGNLGGLNLPVLVAWPMGGCWLRVWLG